ncbi:MAG TPA: hypothetical protein VNV25_25235 [Gemmatimonadaceae bacterium]|nr:hypothetical protein [Gemmatimonadaceae bacterium]
MILSHGTYNPGARPFAPQPVCRFDGDKKIGDPGVTYEFNVKIYGLASNADQVDWDDEVSTALSHFKLRARLRWPWIGSIEFSGRSGGWLAVEDPQGKMTKRSLEAMQKVVAKGLAAFKRHMIRTYPR